MAHRFYQATIVTSIKPSTRTHKDATHTHTHLLNMAHEGLAVETADSFLTLDTLLPLLLMVELRGLWVEEVFALYLPEDLMRVEPPAPWWVNTGGLGEGGGEDGERREGERGRGREGERERREREMGRKRFGSVRLS